MSQLVEQKLYANPIVGRHRPSITITEGQSLCSLYAMVNYICDQEQYKAYTFVTELWEVWVSDAAIAFEEGDKKGININHNVSLHRG